MGFKSKGVKQISQTSFQITFTYQGTTCRENIKCKPTASNFAIVKRHRIAIQDAIANDTFDYAVTFPNSKNAAKFSVYKGENTLISHYLAEWLKDKEISVRASTFDSYRKIINNQLIPAFGHKTIGKLKRTDLKEYCMSLNCSAKRIKNILSPMRVALQDAVYDGYIKDNPLYNWQYKVNEPPKLKQDDIDPFTQDELKAILKALTGQDRNLVQILIDNGLRPSEAIAIEWKDIDFIHNTININKARTNKAKQAEPPKTLAGIRLLHAPKTTMNALKDQKQYTFLIDKEVFFNPRTDARWLGDEQIRKSMWRPALKKAGVRYRYPYQLRHTYASMKLMKAKHIGDLMSLAQQIGHETWTFTAKTYGRFIPHEFKQFSNQAIK